MKEAEIRPQDLLEKYMDLSRKDAKRMDRSTFVNIECPACTSTANRFKFIKNDFTYVQCMDCGSLYCSPRPGPKVLNSFYEESESSHYWASVFFPAVAETRREKLFQQKAKKIQEVVAFKNKRNLSICDVGAGYGIFLEELAKVFPLAELYAIEPSPELAKVCKNKGFTTMISSAEESVDWRDRFDLIISSEVIEHVFSAEDFLRSLHQLSKPNGQVLLTGLGYEGFDILVLQDKSNSIFPPHHLNFLSIEGFEILFNRIGFKKVDIWTPGVLDVDIVMNSGFVPEFLKILGQREGALEKFQSYLASQRLSSHVWCLGVR